MSEADATVMEVEGGGEGETFEVGKTYAVTLFTGIEFNGIVLAYDSNPNFVIFQDGTTPTTGNSMTTRMVNAKFITKLRFLGKVKDPLASKKCLVDLDGLLAKEADAIRQIERSGVGVPAEAQSMFDALSTTLPVQSENKDILVPDCVSGGTKAANQQVNRMLSSFDLEGGKDSDSSSPKPSSPPSGGSGGSGGSSSGSGGSSSGSDTGSSSGSGSKTDDSTDSVHFGCKADSILIQFQANKYFNKGLQERLNTDHGHTTVFNNVPGILLNNFTSGWNACVDGLGPLNSIDLDDVLSAIRFASYRTGLVLDSLMDQTPQRLPTEDYQDLFGAWCVAGFLAGRYMLEKYRYETQLEMTDFTDFFTLTRF